VRRVEPRIGQQRQTHRRSDRAGAGRELTTRKLLLQRTLGGGPGRSGLGYQPRAAVVVSESRSGLDLAARLLDEADLAECAHRERGPSHRHTILISFR
jgi:hypothetical protein